MEITKSYLVADCHENGAVYPVTFDGVFEPYCGWVGIGYTRLSSPDLAANINWLIGCDYLNPARMTIDVHPDDLMDTFDDVIKGMKEEAEETHTSLPDFTNPRMITLKFDISVIS